MADIDIGSACINRTSQVDSGATHIYKDNPANAAGTITKVWIWAMEAMSGVEVATFYKTNGNVFSTRGTAAIGDVPAGSAQEFAVNLEVEIGDYIGMYFADGVLELTSSGPGLWYKTGDHIPCTELACSWWADVEASVYGEGEVPSVTKTLVQAALISIGPLIVLPTLGQIIKVTGGC